MTNVLFHQLWQNHPGKGDSNKPNTYPCDKTMFENQCAVRMGVALDKSGIDTRGFAVRRCSKAFPALKAHHPGHILAAQELADALDRYSALWPAPARTRKFRGSIEANRETFDTARGIVFIQNGWGNVDHIDMWDGSLGLLKGADGLSFNMVGSSVWLWKLA